MAVCGLSWEEGAEAPLFLRPCSGLVVDEEVRDVVPDIAVVVEVAHGGLERGLQSVGVVLKEPQNDAPDQCCEQGEGVFLWLGDVAFLHS